MKTVKDMYAFTSSHNMKLLSDFSADYWTEYISNYQKYDKLFRRMFLSFGYYLQNKTDSLEAVTVEFIDEVYNHLLLNNKKYSELYRINVVNEDDYSIIDNYNITESMSKDGSRDDTLNYGARTDSTTINSGSQTNSQTNSVSPFDSENFYNDRNASNTIGAREDTGSSTKGAEEDTNSSVYEEDYTLTRKGNIGIQTATDIMKKHKEFWNIWQFYEYIFKDIAKELLTINLVD